MRRAGQRVLVAQLDGKLPNLALMRIAAHHKARGDKVDLRLWYKPAAVRRDLFNEWDMVYASLIFERTRPVAMRLRELFPDAVIGGTGWDRRARVEDHGIATDSLDYGLYPAFRSSMGFTQRGCRLNCSFCVVPEKEGKVQPVATIQDIWRGEPWPRELLLLDNDFFGQDCWRERIAEIRDGGFKVSFNQGINARMLSDEAAAAIASVNYRDDGMKDKRIYTAWDSMGDERPLFRGLNALVKHGIRPDNIMVYMLVGYASLTITEDDLYRHRRLLEFGCRPFPMAFNKTKELCGFQRWVIRRCDRFVSWEDFKAADCRPEKLPPRRLALPTV